MSDLVTFLTARLDEDEAVALAWPAGDWEGLASDGKPWRDSHGQYIYAPRARVLADVAAKRRIMELHALNADPCDAHDGATMESVPCDTLLALVQSYCDHPDFDPAWRP